MNRTDFMRLAESLGWGVYECDDGSIEIGRYSDYGQDFSQTLWFDDNADDTTADIRSEVYACYENFDPSYQTMLWLGPDGHGRNGAPHDMRDVLADMEECDGYLKELYEAVMDFGR